MRAWPVEQAIMISAGSISPSSPITFLFCCFTGLAYSDVQKLEKSQIARGIGGEPWIFTQRTKTNVKSHIPLLPEALQIMDRYKDHPLCDSRGLVLLVPSNQKMNDYLKEIAVIVGLIRFLLHKLPGIPSDEYYLAKWHAD
jgi:hypothetical protein